MIPLPYSPKPARSWRKPPQPHEFTEVGRPVCGGWMPRARESCGRRPGHGHEHRTAYALENARRARAA